MSPDRQPFGPVVLGSMNCVPNCHHGTIVAWSLSQWKSASKAATGRGSFAGKNDATANSLGAVVADRLALQAQVNVWVPLAPQSPQERLICADAMPAPSTIRAQVMRTIF